jgi:signal transduction histidine kinase
MGRSHYRIFGVTWYLSPLAIILWMIYAADDQASPYYAGLNIVLLAVGLISPWTYIQNLMSTLFVLVMYVVVCFAMETPQPKSIIINNTTFLVLTAALVVSGSVANARQRYREFGLRWELDKNRRIVEESNRKLMELDQIKSRFFANISHELRTPLTLLMAPLETLIHGYGRAFDDETRGILVSMHSNAMRLLKLINDLLDLVRLDSGVMQVKHEPVEVGEFLRGLVSAASQVAREKGIRLESSVPADLGRVMLDRDKLEKVVLNLQFNALKFTPAGGRVEVRGHREDGQLVLQVADTGMGISEKNLPFVFDRFWQADGSSRRKYQGVGIGLALVKELVEIQDGSVSVESQEGIGTTFTVRLPWQSEESGDVPVQAGVQADSDTRPNGSPVNASLVNDEWVASLYRRAELFPAMTASRDGTGRPEASRDVNHPKVLIADDEPDMLRFLASQLGRRYQVFEAVDGQQAIDKAREILPDIILLDMMMPEKDGLQACREIRESAATQSIPIIILTARADEETKLAALSAGASDFLPKPFSTTELHVRVKNLIEAYEFQRDLGKQNQALESTIEQLKETEMQLVQTEKIASLGRMSAGIIHEINNPLNFATTGLFALRKKAICVPESRQAEFAEILNDVEEGIRRVKTIVSELRSFSHPDTDHRDHVRVTEIMNDALKFLSSEWKDKIKIVRNFPDQQTIWGNKNRLVQVVLNLLQNSFDACQRKSYEAEPPTVWIDGAMESGKSILTIRDNGDGIDPDCMDKIFDPFFTTKDVGDGMGLGLSISYRIIREHDGHVRARSERGKSTEFTLEFPVNSSN